MKKGLKIFIVCFASVLISASYLVTFLFYTYRSDKVNYPIDQSTLVELNDIYTDGASYSDIRTDLINKYTYVFDNNLPVFVQAGDFTYATDGVNIQLTLMYFENDNFGMMELTYLDGEYYKDSFADGVVTKYAEYFNVTSSLQVKQLFEKAKNEIKETMIANFLEVEGTVAKYDEVYLNFDFDNGYEFSYCTENGSFQYNYGLDDYQRYFYISKNSSITIYGQEENLL